MTTKRCSWFHGSKGLPPHLTEAAKRLRTYAAKRLLIYKRAGVPLVLRNWLDGVRLWECFELTGLTS